MKKNNLEKEIKEIKELLQLQSVQSDEHLGLEGACKFTGFKPSYLYKLTCLKQIPYYKPNNKKIYFSKNELREWIFRNKHRSNSEIKEQADTILQGLEG